MVKNIIGSLFLAGIMLVAGTAFAQDQASKDDQVLKEYFAKNHIKANKTPSGLYYTINKKGEGENAKPGQQVSMNYIGKFLDGKKFDGNVDENGNPVNGRTAFRFTLGMGQVIRGWDEGIQLLNKGCKATLYLPSGIAYGAGARGPIPANSILVFDVEVLGMQ